MHHNDEIMWVGWKIMDWENEEDSGRRNGWKEELQSTKQWWINLWRRDQNDNVGNLYLKCITVIEFVEKFAIFRN